jgi:hypothetical protein
MGSAETNWLWYGDRPYSYESWTMDVDSLYRIIDQANATGMLTVNYGYARYGTGLNPVANAAHMAADWVRYDNGRSEFWEIGNEVFGSWEAGYRIDQALNKDGQPEYVTPSLYGQHSLVYIDSMKKASQETGADIRIGLVMAEASSTSPGWNMEVAARAGDYADFYCVHSYFTPWNANSDVETILDSYTRTGEFINYVWSEAEKAGKPKLPVALTEYNIFAVGSNQPVSHVNGMHAVLVTGEAIKTGYGAATRWDLANGWDNGNDHGMFSYNEPGIPDYTPHPAFYHLYYLRKYAGDVLLNYSTIGAEGIVVVPTAFSSGHMGAAIVNTAKLEKVVRLNIQDFKFGDRYFTYTLKGTSGEDFSRKVFVNDTGPALEAGGPENYESIKANSSLIMDEIRIKAPPLSVTFILVEPGTRELAVNTEVSADEIAAGELVIIYPNPGNGTFTISNIPYYISSVEIKDFLGRTVYLKSEGINQPEDTFHSRLYPGIYFIILADTYHYRITKKLIIK